MCSLRATFFRSPARFPRPLLIPTPSKAYIDLRVHLSIPLEHLKSNKDVYPSGWGMQLV